MKALPMIALGMLLASAQATAQKELADPTRPPTLAPSPQAPSAAEALVPELQSILISPARRIAVINGESVALGGKIGGATLLRVSETEVVLKHGSEMRALKLYPSVVKRPVRLSASGKPSRARGERKR